MNVKGEWVAVVITAFAFLGIMVYASITGFIPTPWQDAVFASGKVVGILANGFALFSDRTSFPGVSSLPKVIFASAGAYAYLTLGFYLSAIGTFIIAIEWAAMTVMNGH